jgi:hypothetical protein
MSGRVFINYRKALNKTEARLLQNTLEKHFGRRGVFRDESGLEAGKNWLRELEREVDKSSILVALIGHGWANIGYKEGDEFAGAFVRRLDNPDDFVRFEIARALSRGIPIVPVLIDGAALPETTALPRQLQPLTWPQAAIWRNESYEADGEALAKRLKALIRERPERGAPAWMFAAVAAGALLTGMAFWPVAWRIGEVYPPWIDAPADMASMRQSDEKQQIAGLDSAVKPAAQKASANPFAADGYEDMEKRLIRTLEGHSDQSGAVAVAPDGRMIVSGGDEGVAKLWDAKTGTLQKTFEGHRSSVRAVAFSPDSRFIVSGSLDNTLKLWDADSGRLLHTLEGHSGSVHAATFSPDGKTVLSGGGDKTLRFWEMETGRLIKTLEAHGDGVRTAAFSPDGEMVLSGSDDTTLKIWDAASSRLIRTLDGHSNIVFTAAFAPDGKTIVSGSGDATLHLWDAATGRLIRSMEGHGNWVRAAAFSPDGKSIVSGGYDKTLKLWDAANGRLRYTLEGHGHVVLAAVFTPDGTSVASGGGDVFKSGTGYTRGHVKLWDVSEWTSPQTASPTRFDPVIRKN